MLGNVRILKDVYCSEYTEHVSGKDRLVVGAQWYGDRDRQKDTNGDRERNSERGGDSEREKEIEREGIMHKADMTSK